MVPTRSNPAGTVARIAAACRAQPLAVVLTGLALAMFLADAMAIAAITRHADLLDYPFTFPDTWDWLTNALFYAAAPVECSWRPPLTALLQALVIDHERVLLCLSPAWFLTGALLYFLAAGNLGEGALAACLYLAGHLYFGNALYVGNDLAASTLDFAALVATAQPVRSRSRAMLAGLLWGLAFLAGGAALLAIAIGVVAQVVLARRQAMRGLALAATVAFLVLAPYYAFKWVSTGSLTYSSVQHVEYLTVHIDAIPYYLAAQLCRASPPVLLLAAMPVIGWLRAWRRDRTRETFTPYWLIAVVVPFAFFACTYEWRDNRFLLYCGQPIYLLAARGIVTLSRAPCLARARPVVVLALLGVTAWWSTDGHYRHDPLASRVWLAPQRELVHTGLDGALAIMHTERWLPMPAQIAAAGEARAARRAPNPAHADLRRAALHFATHAEADASLAVLTSRPELGYIYRGMMAYLTRRRVVSASRASEPAAGASSWWLVPSAEVKKLALPSTARQVLKLKAFRLFRQERAGSAG